MAAASLTGWTVGVTADRRAGEQAELLARRGARVVHGATIKTLALGREDDLRDAIDAVIASPPDAVVLTTGIGTRALFEAADAYGRVDRLSSALRHAFVIARGPKAAGAALTVGLNVSWQAPEARSTELVEYLAVRGVAGRSVAVQLDGRDTPVLGNAVRALGADVVDLPVYRWILPDDASDAVRLVSATCEERLDAVTFTSAPALRNYIEIARRAGMAERAVDALRGRVAAVSIGVVCTEAARELGIEPAVEPERPRLGAMVLALGRYAEERDASAAVRVGERVVVLRAAGVVVDGMVVDLPDREASALRVLLDRRGAVVSKSTLLHAWQAGSDPHAVEVVIARLRARLAGYLGIATVPRRGYVLTGP